MKKFMKAKPSSRRDFLRKSALGVASAGLLGSEMLRGNGKESKAHDSPAENQETSKQDQKVKHSKPITRSKDGKTRRIERIQAKDQDEVQWEAPKDSDIAIMFAPGRDPAGVGTAVVKAKQLSKVYTVNALTKESEAYKYQIYCYATDEYVQSNSEPELIVP